jgi:DNA-binding CsgD family transcriptional regulator
MLGSGQLSNRQMHKLLRDIPVPSEHWLRHIFDLTPAEARLAQGLARGDALEQVARTLGIKMSTARTQLAVIFAKTQTPRQSALVAVLTRIASLAV